MAEFLSKSCLIAFASSVCFCTRSSVLVFLGALIPKMSKGKEWEILRLERTSES